MTAILNFLALYLSSKRTQSRSTPSAKVPDENHHSSQDNLTMRQAQQYFDNEYVGK